MLFFFVLNCSYSQICGFDKYLENSIKTNPEYERNLVEKVTRLTRTKERGIRTDNIITIPVVFNLVYPANQSQGIGSITLSDLEREIEKLNKAFSGELGQHIKVDTKIRFCLARNDVFGNDRLGVNRYNGYSSYQPYIDTGTREEQINHFENLDARLKQNRNANFPSSTFLNVWITDLKSSNGSDGLLGYSSFPFDLEDIDPQAPSIPKTGDGIVLDYTQLVAGNRSLTHETGHWLGLFHTFQNLNIHTFGITFSCEENDPYTQGDLVYDTDPMSNKRNPFTNIVPGKTCIGYECNELETIDVQNYMYYYKNSCYSFFSQGQKERMRDVLSEYRPFIANSLSNHCETTGTGSDDNPTSGGNGSSGFINCGKCYTPSLQPTFDYTTNWGEGYRGMSQRYKGTLHVRGARTQDSKDISELVFSRKLCNQLVEEGYLNYSSSIKYGSANFILDDNTYLVNLYKPYRSNFSEIKIFKKINTSWIETKTININGFLLNVRENRTYLQNKIENNRGGNLYSYDLTTETSKLIFKSTSSKRMFLTNKGYNIASASGFEIEEWIYNDTNDSYYLKESHNFPKPAEYSHYPEIYIHKNYAITYDYFEDTYVYTKKNGAWTISQNLGRIPVKDENSLINDNYFVTGRVLNGNFCHPNTFYKKNANGIFEAITDYKHMDVYSNKPVERLVGFLNTINKDQNEIILSDQILKLSDILQDDSFKGFNNSIEICSEVISPIKAKDVKIGGNCSLTINNSTEIIATNRIVIKPKTRIKSSKLLLRVSNSNINDCGFNAFCVTSTSAPTPIPTTRTLENLSRESISKEITKINYIFPNPNKNRILNIKNYEEIVHIEIYSLAGFLEFSTKNIQSQISIPKMRKGIFNVKLYTVNNKIIDEKLILE